MTVSTAFGRAAAVLGLLAAALVAVPGAPASAGTDPEALLRDARQASEDVSLAGIVEVRWREGGSMRVERTGARSRGGAYVVGRGENVAVGAEGDRWAADDGIATRWGHIEGDDPPRPGSTWRLALGDPAEVAGREAYVIVARRDDGPARARFYVDKSLGLLLRRDVLQRDGDVERSVRFTRLAANDVVPAVPPVPPGAPGPITTDDVGPRFVAPEELEPGFELLGQYEHPDGTVQLFYGDGLFSLSVFEQPGSVDWGSLPEGAREGDVDGERAALYATAAGTVVVWGRDDLVLTGVSDAPPDVARAAIAAVDGGGDGFLTELVDFVLGPFGWN
jgi:sigma-E factor negative regulatory protein RseB